MPDNWMLQMPKHSKQSDSISCGIFVLKFAENSLVGRPVDFKWNGKDIKQARMSLAVFLLSLSQPSTCVESNTQINVQTTTCLDATCTSEAELQVGTSFDVIVNSEPEETVTEHKTYPCRERKPKRKRSSFLYWTTKKRQRQKFCLCQKPDDGRKYWCCDSCNNWFHPLCVGKKEEDEKETFFCPYCEKTDDDDIEDLGSDENVPGKRDSRSMYTKIPHDDDNREDLGSDKDEPGKHDSRSMYTNLPHDDDNMEDLGSDEDEPGTHDSGSMYTNLPHDDDNRDGLGSDEDEPGIHDSGSMYTNLPHDDDNRDDLGSDEDEPGTHDSRRIIGKTALEMYPTTVEKIKDMLECSDSKCNKVHHQRHHCFLANPWNFIRRQKKKFGFGQVYFSQNTMEVLNEKVMADLLYKVRDKKNQVTSLPSMMLRYIPEDSAFWNLFIEHKLLATQYILYVLIKELLIWVASAQTGEPYEMCKGICLSTEMDSKALFGI